jgi:hypothetical protein
MPAPAGCLDRKTGRPLQPKYPRVKGQLAKRCSRITASIVAEFLPIAPAQYRILGLRSRR